MRWIHWAFLIPAFIAGFVAGYASLYQMAKVASQVTAAIEEATKCLGVETVQQQPSNQVCQTVQWQLMQDRCYSLSLRASQG